MSCLCATTRLAARSVTRVYEAEFRAAGLKAPQFWLLAELYQRKKRASQVELLRDAAIDQTTLSRNLAVLVRRKWVKSEARGRERLYGLTPEGRAMVVRAQSHWKKAQEKMRKALGADWETVFDALNKLAAATAAIELGEQGD